MKNSDLERDMPYQASMLPDVDYDIISDDDAFFSLIDLEHGTLESCLNFLNELKPVLLEEKLQPVPEWLIAHFFAYLGCAMTVHTVMGAQALEPLVILLIEEQAKVALQYFNQYPLNGKASSEQKNKSIAMLRQKTPGSIFMQTIRLGNVIMETLKELKHNQPLSHYKKSDEMFCSQETLIKIILYLSSQQCAKWREQFDGLSDHYAINQLATQIGWIVGYFAHISEQSSDKISYLEFGLPVISFYREHIFKLMETFAEAKFAQEAADDSEKAQSLLTDIHQLSEKMQSQAFPVITDFQKQFLLAKATIEKTLIALLEEECSIKPMLMGIFYFWFLLAVPLYSKKPNGNASKDAFVHMGNIIDLIKEKIKNLPDSELSTEIQALNEKLQALKQHISDPEELDYVPPEQVAIQVPKANTAIHSITSDLLKQGVSMEAVANALFCHWLRLSVFFGVSEKDWQKMDYYFSDLLKSIKGYIERLPVDK